MQKLFNKFLGAESHAAKNPFDLSTRQVYSTKVGLLNVPAYFHTMGDSTYSIDMEHVCRTQPLETAAFTKFSSHYEWFFVPYNDIYHSFNQVLAQREDKQSITAPSLEMPYFDLGSFLSFILPFAAFDYLVSSSSYQTDDTGERVSYFLRVPYIDMFDWGFDFQYFDINSIGSISHSHRQLYLLTREFDNESVFLGVIRMLDMYGYGNFLPLVKQLAHTAIALAPKVNGGESYMSYQNFFNDVIIKIRNGQLPYSPEPGARSDRALEYVKEIQRSIQNAGSICNLWLPCAYNKVFEQVYRNPYYDFISEFTPSTEFRNIGFDLKSFEYVYLFNLDDIQGSLDDNQRLLHIFAPHYHQYHKDMFTGVMPDTQFGDVSVLTDDRSWLNLQLKGSSESGSAFFISGASNTYAPAISSSDNLSGQDVKARFDPALAISVLNMRKAEALQRFSENMMRAGNRTRDAFRAHFGFTPLSEARNNVLSLGSFDGDIDLNVVASTSETDTLQLGQLAANGVGTIGGKTIKFNSHDFGVLLCIGYIHKPAEYDAYGLDKLNQNLDPFDYPYNEFQNISLSPLESVRLGYQ